MYEFLKLVEQMVGLQIAPDGRAADVVSVVGYYVGSFFAMGMALLVATQGRALFQTTRRDLNRAITASLIYATLLLPIVAGASEMLFAEKNWGGLSIIDIGVSFLLLCVALILLWCPISIVCGAALCVAYAGKYRGISDSNARILVLLIVVLQCLYVAYVDIDMRS
jgi:hypothetical protein